MNGQDNEALRPREDPARPEGGAEGPESDRPVLPRSFADPESRERFSAELLDLIVRYFCRDRSLGLKTLVADFERDVIGFVLKETGWNQRKAARILGVKYTTLNHKVIKHGLLTQREGREAAAPGRGSGFSIPDEASAGPRQA